jgi:hypothetical protein
MSYRTAYICGLSLPGDRLASTGLKLRIRKYFLRIRKYFLRIRIHGYVIPTYAFGSRRPINNRSGRKRIGSKPGNFYGIKMNHSVFYLKYCKILNFFLKFGLKLIKKGSGFVIKNYGSGCRRPISYVSFRSGTLILALRFHGAKVVERNTYMRENVKMWYIKILWCGALRNTRSSEGNQGNQTANCSCSLSSLYAITAFKHDTFSTWFYHVLLIHFRTFKRQRKKKDLRESVAVIHVFFMDFLHQ